ncbi:MAG: hypothetical protein WCG21_10590 [Eubacteriales bacterium]
MNNADTKEVERNTDIIAAFTGGDPEQMQKDIDGLGAQGLIKSIESLAYPEEVVQKIKELDEFLKITKDSEKK